MKTTLDTTPYCRCGKSWIEPEVSHFELVVPLYKAVELIPGLMAYIKELQNTLPCDALLTFVIDGDVDQTKDHLVNALKDVNFSWKILKFSRNFGVGPALMAAFNNSNSCIVSAFGADLQEPKEIFLDFLNILSDPEKHIALGARKSRKDPFFTSLASKIYWILFRKVVSPDLPSGGFDVFALSERARSSLCSMPEKNTNITAQIDWLGFSREFVYFDRLPRSIGKSSWKLTRKIKLFMDSFYGFTDLPIMFLLAASLLGIFLSSFLGVVIFVSWILGNITVPGYASIIIFQIFSTNLILFVVSLFSGYSTRAFENSKSRPLYIIESVIKSR